jgi:hypothetical protein
MFGRALVSGAAKRDHSGLFGAESRRARRRLIGVIFGEFSDGAQTDAIGGKIQRAGFEAFRAALAYPCANLLSSGNAREIYCLRCLLISALVNIGPVSRRLSGWLDGPPLAGKTGNIREEAT